MDETMNLNGMGVGTTPSPTISTIDISNEIVKNQEIKSDNSEVVNVSSLQSTETNLNNATPEPTKIEASNEIDFQDLDMIKELRAEEEANRKKESIFSSMDFGPLKKYLEDDDVTDISYSNGGQLWLKTLSKGVYRVDERDINDALIEKIAFQCSNVMGKTFNMAHPFLDSESAELRMNFIHDSIARNGIAVVFRKTPAKIRLEKEKLMKENYVSLSIHDFLIKAVQGHCNIIMCGETGSGKTEFLKYLASHTFENEKIVTVEDTLELHLDRIYPHRDIVAMKTNNVASYSDVLVTCMRQNPIWILLSEVRSAEAVTAVRNSISSGHFILSTIHADKAANIPYRLYSLLESNIDVDQFLNTIYRYVQIGVFLRGRFDPRQGRYVREIGEVTEFYVNENNECITNTIYQKTIRGDVTYKPISEHLLEYLEGQGMDMRAIREANGDLEKAQEYIDELSKETLEKDQSINADKLEEDSDDDSNDGSNASSSNQSEKKAILEEIKLLSEKRGIKLSLDTQVDQPPIVQPITEGINAVSVEPKLEEKPIEVPITPIEPLVNNVVEEQSPVPLDIKTTPDTQIVQPPIIQPITEGINAVSVEPKLEERPIEVPITQIEPLFNNIVEEQSPVPLDINPTPDTQIVQPPIIQPITEGINAVSVEPKLEEKPVEVLITPIGPVVTPVMQDIKTLITPTDKPQPTKPLIDSAPNQQNNNWSTPNSLIINDNTPSGDNGSSNVNFTVPNITNIQ